MPRLIAILACLGLILSAWQAPSTGKPPAAQTPADPLTTADARLFAGDYDGAESAFLKLIAAENALLRARVSDLEELVTRLMEENDRLAVVQAARVLDLEPEQREMQPA